MQWYSRKGNECVDNRDFGIYLHTPAFELAMIVDGSQRGTLGACLAKDWGTVVIEAARTIGTFGPEELRQLLLHSHEQLRYRYLAETASYAIAWVDRSGSGWAMSCGDCRVGLLNTDQKNWLTPVHTLANAIDGSFERRHALLPSRHTVTRCWKATRFDQPAVVKFNLGQDRICLATDGHWLEHEWLVKPLDELADDASCLVLDHDAFASNLQTDCDNFQMAQNFN